MNNFHMTPGTPIIEAQNISKSYDNGVRKLEVLKKISLAISEGDSVCIMGASGAGKSTLLHVLGTLDRPTQGDVFYKGMNLSQKSDEELSAFRNKKMGFVFQFHHLLPEFTALENVMMPCRIFGETERECRGRCMELLRELGLSERVTHFPSQLSGGEQQRVAIARALAMKPEVLFADEPTGNLDSHNSQKIQQLFFELKRKFNLTLVVVSHDRDFARNFPKVYQLHDGQWVT